MGKGLSIADTAFLKASGVTPVSFPGLHRWYKADSYSGIANDGDSIGGGGNTRGPWIDQTGSGDDATAAAGPIFKTNIVGTMPIIRFSGAGPAMLFVPGALTDFTVVAALSTTAGVDAFICYNNVSAHQLRRIFFGTDEMVFYAGGAIITGTTLVGNAFEVVTCARAGTAVTFRKNLSAEGGGVDGNPWTVVQIGNGSSGSTKDLGELMIYTTALSVANLNQLYTEYLKPRWTTLP